jgi:four helix bundle protein
MAIRSYRQLVVWAKAMSVAKAVYLLTRSMPRQEEYRMTAQMIRAAISIPANIAEGHTRATRKEYAHFVSSARGSAAELETLLLLAEDAALLPRRETTPVLADVEEVARMLTSLYAKLRAPSP